MVFFYVWYFVFEVWWDVDVFDGVFVVEVEYDFCVYLFEYWVGDVLWVLCDEK